MSKVLTDDSNYAAIAEAIRAKGGASSTLKPGQMAAAVAAIPTGGSAVIESKSITANGTYTTPTGVDGYNPVTVNVPNSYTASDEGKVVSNGALVVQTALTITANGTYDTTTNNSVVVNAGGGSELIGTNPPTADLGNAGDYYIQQTISESVMFGITITTPARGTSYNFTYWGARDIQLVFEDTGGNDILLKDLSVKSCKWAQGTSAFSSQDAVISGNSSQYYEHSGKPGYWQIEANVPSGYKIKGLKVIPRTDSSYRDFWRTFTLEQWVASKTPVGSPLVSVVDSVQADWLFDGNYNVFSFTPTDIPRVPEAYLWHKNSSGWTMLK